ncbi:hypothetical protein [Methylovulum sp.]|uniref:hypothetical protein n=1 Tax=Methylovulum sp. TaxID=1916980 RepID=UPI002614DBDB|nr:hypothetical protein [Methylovulum sp.]MDD5124329.1 hypothetical protein [Methylovulum sp.]
MTKIHPLALFSLFFVGSIHFNSSQAATTYDATNDFTANTTSNPNGVWGYGYDPASVAGYQFKSKLMINSLLAQFFLGLIAPIVLWTPPHFGKIWG